MLGRFALLAIPLALLAALAIAPQVRGQGGDAGSFENTEDVRAAIARAQRASQRAAERGRSLEAAAAEAEEEAEKVRQEKIRQEMKKVCWVSGLMFVVFIVFLFTL